MIIGITGSSGAGKSTVCEILEEEYQIKVLNADKMAKQLSKKGNEYLTDIVTLFGEEILQENGELDRPKLANIIYGNSQKRELLNQCTFKHIHIAIQKEIQRILSENPKAVIAIDAPLLFEAKLEDIYLVYDKFQNSIKEKFLDENDCLTYLADNLKNTNIFDNAIIFIDEFVRFYTSRI